MFSNGSCACLSAANRYWLSLPHGRRSGFAVRSAATRLAAVETLHLSIGLTVLKVRSKQLCLQFRPRGVHVLVIWLVARADHSSGRHDSTRQLIELARAFQAEIAGFHRARHL